MAQSGGLPDEVEGFLVAGVFFFLDFFFLDFFFLDFFCLYRCGGVRESEKRENKKCAGG